MEAYYLNLITRSSINNVVIQILREFFSICEFVIARVIWYSSYSQYYFGTISFNRCAVPLKSWKLRLESSNIRDFFIISLNKMILNNLLLHFESSFILLAIFYFLNYFILTTASLEINEKL